jgi:hypothetical protein
LNTRGDVYSTLSGKELIRRKVKLLVCMAGKFPSGFEFNVMQDAKASKNVFENWNTPIILSGFEIGEKIKAGLPLINNAAIKNNPVKDVFRISIPLAKEDSAGRKSWDETAVLVAIKGYSQWYNLHKGKMVVAADGSNTWDDKGTGQAYLVEKVDFKVVQDIINSLIMHQPENKISRKKLVLNWQDSRKRQTKGRIAKIEELSNKVDKIERNVRKTEAKIKKAEDQIARIESHQ